MPNRTKSDLKTYVNGLLPDNNAGEISAADVRNSVIDTIDSIETIVASGNFNSSTPFLNDVRLQKNSNVGGKLFVESGIVFPNGAGENVVQLVPYPGPQGISHSSLGSLDTGDPHTQYVPISGTRSFTGSVGFRNNWINSSGQSDPSSYNGYRGLQFTRVNQLKETINVGSGTSFNFLTDNSVMSSARGVARAWIRFQGSGTGGGGNPTVLDAYNISGIKKEDVGKFTIIFNSGILKDNNYVAFGHSNARSSASSREDFSENTVSMAYRVGDDAQKLRSVSFVVMSDSGVYCDGIVNDLVVFGAEPGGSGYATSVTINPSYTA